MSDPHDQRPACALTVDVEAWFHARLAGVPRGEQDRRDPQLEGSVDRLLEMLDGAGARATFFVLGAVARTHPGMIRRIAASHEVASHGETHRDLRELDHADLAFEIASSRARLQELSGQPVIGFRAPNWSMSGCEEVALPLLVEHGYRYDSSLLPGPGLFFLRGAGEIPRGPHPHPLCPEIWELPPTVVRLPGISFPLGGNFLRLLPRRLVRELLARNARRAASASVHLHPWELPGGLPGALRPLRRLSLAGGSRTLSRKLAEILVRHRCVALEESWRRCASRAEAGRPRLSRVSRA